MTAIAHFIREAQADFEAEQEAEAEAENCLGTETLETVSAGWEAGAVLTPKRGYPGEYVPMRLSPFADWKFRRGDVLETTRFLHSTEKAFLPEYAWTGGARRGSAGFALYSVLSLVSGAGTEDHAESEAIGDSADGRRLYAHHEVNREAREAEALERFISRSLDRAQSNGIALTQDAIDGIANRCRLATEGRPMPTGEARSLPFDFWHSI